MNLLAFFPSSALGFECRYLIQGISLNIRCDNDILMLSLNRQGSDCGFCYLWNTIPLCRTTYFERKILLDMILKRMKFWKVSQPEGSYHRQAPILRQTGRHFFFQLVHSLTFVTRVARWTKNFCSPFKESKPELVCVNRKRYFIFLRNTVRWVVIP